MTLHSMQGKKECVTLKCTHFPVCAFNFFMDLDIALSLAEENPEQKYQCESPVQDKAEC